MVEYPQSFISISKTATDDNKFNLTGISDMWFSELNIYVETNAAKYGDTHEQEASISVGDIISFQFVNLKEMFFINANAGDNTVIRAVGALMLEPHRKSLLGRWADLKRV